MKKGTVRRRIFVSDTAVVLTTLFLFLLVNLLVLKIYSEAIEKAFLDSTEQIVNAQELEELLKQRILYQNKFLLLTAADGIACVLILIGVSRFFTRNLTSHIMEPLDTLAEGAKRIQNNDLQQAKNIRYTCTQVAEARRHLGEPFLQNREPQRIAFEPVALMKDQSFVINYLTDGLRNGTAFGGPDLTVKGCCQTEPSGPEILSGKGMCLYEMGFPQHETVEKVFTTARAAGLSPESVYCEMVLENVVPEKCLFQYFTAERSQI